EFTRASIPTFVDAWTEVFGRGEDDQYDALVAESRGSATDDRSPLFEQLEAALPVEGRATLRAFDAAWSRHAEAREDAAYLIGAAIGQSRRCPACEAERERSVDAFVGMLRAWGREEEASRFLEQRRARCAS
ncbi:MAG TPA: hypothetical protein VGD94_12365, partial [Vicinamibacterales bacterium]